MSFLSLVVGVLGEVPRVESSANVKSSFGVTHYYSGKRLVFRVHTQKLVPDTSFSTRRSGDPHRLTRSLPCSVTHPKVPKVDLMTSGQSPPYFRKSVVVDDGLCVRVDRYTFTSTLFKGGEGRSTVTPRDRNTGYEQGQRRSRGTKVRCALFRCVMSMSVQGVTTVFVHVLCVVWVSVWLWCSTGRHKCQKSGSVSDRVGSGRDYGKSLTRQNVGVFAHMGEGDRRRY